MAGKVTWALLDGGGERSSVAVTIPDYTAGNAATLTTQIAALRAALEGVSRGQIVSENLVVSDVVVTGGSNPPNTAQRELKWLVQYQNPSNLKVYRLEIPTPNPNLVVAGDPAKPADLSAQAWIDFVAAFNTIVRDPINANDDANFLKANIAGRNI